MYIKDGKSLFGNIGIILSIIILLILVILSYSKCNASSNPSLNSNMNNNNYSRKIKNIIEHFDITTPNTTQSTPEPKNVRINIKGNQITMDFTVDLSNNAPRPKQFIMLLIQYDSNLRNTGNVKMYMSNEYDINGNVSINMSTANTNVCVMNNDQPACKYVFNNIDIIDSNGNLYYYKCGVIAVYSWGNSRIVVPYNVNTVNNIFSLDTSLDQQNNLYASFQQFKQQQENKQTSDKVLNNTMSTANGQYEIIKSQIGNYPDNLILDPNSNSSLNDLVDKSMALGIIDVNVNIEKPTQPQLE